jgi:hypothetical protein
VFGLSASTSLPEIYAVPLVMVRYVVTVVPLPKAKVAGGLQEEGNKNSNGAQDASSFHRFRLF